MGAPRPWQPRLRPGARGRRRTRRPDSFVVDHFSEAGTRRHRLLGPARPRRRRSAACWDAGGALFEDSLEIETDATLWTPGSGGVREQRGLRPLRRSSRGGRGEREVPVRLRRRPTTPGAPDSATINQVLSNLYLDNHLRPLQAWPRLRPGSARPAVRPARPTVGDRRVLDVPGERVARLQEPRRLPPPGRRAGPRRASSPLQRGRRYAGGAYNTTWQTVRSSTHQQHVRGGRQPGRDARLRLPSPRLSRGPASPRSAVLQGAPATARRGVRASRVGARPRRSRATSPAPSTCCRPDPAYRHRVPRQKGCASTGIGAGWVTNDGIPIGWTHSFLTAACHRRCRLRDGRGWTRRAGLQGRSCRR